MCPTCGSPTTTPDSRASSSEPVVRRKRVCANGHQFRTMETLVEPAITHLAVRRSGDGLLSETPFDIRKVDEHITEVLFGRKGPLRPHEIHAVTERAVRLIERDLRSLDLALTPEERRGRPDILGAIPDFVITDQIGAVLHEGQGRRYRMAELLYVMAVKGRTDYRSGWADAWDVIQWIRERHERIRMPRQQAGLSTPEVVFVRQTSWRPEKVLKRRTRNLEAPFDTQQFRQSINAALHGREDAGRKATLVVNHVLSQLEGQRIVHSAQLASGVLTALRGVDDVAYLRWATIEKRISSVRPFAEEAADLIYARSPHLDWQSPPR